MILLLGASGYFGQAFEKELIRRQLPYRSIARREVDYTRFDELVSLLRKTGASFVINAAGFTGRPNVDACETARAETLQGNTLLPLTIAHACAAVGITWGHPSSGCIYSGAYVSQGGKTTLERDLSRPELKALAETAPERFRGFTEDDEPNFTFRRPPCSFYSSSKALGEEAIKPLANCYVWRMRLPFDEQDNPRNYLSKLLAYPKIYDNVNSFSHRVDAVKACLDLWELKAPLGIYHITNPGFLTTRQVVAGIQKTLQPKRAFEFWASDEEFYKHAAKTPRSNCILDVSKVVAAGVKLRPVRDALFEALGNWSARV
jgi:dTDP-4-dehydrorhamnose reductase